MPDRRTTPPEVVARFPHAQFFQEPDKGMTDGINKGFRRAQGKWVMWLNADDRLKPGALKAVKEFAEQESGGGCDLRRLGLHGWRRNVHPPHAGASLRFPDSGAAGMLHRLDRMFLPRETTIAEGHLLDDDFGYCMDGEYYARLAHLGKRFVPMPEILADFRLHEESISQKSLGKDDMKNLLRMQRQAAEPRAIRRMYGIKPFKDENLSRCFGCACGARCFGVSVG